MDRGRERGREREVQTDLYLKAEVVVERDR